MTPQYKNRVPGLLPCIYKVMLFGLLLASSGNVLCNTDRQLWFSFSHQGRVSKDWGYWFTLQHRTKNNFASNLYVDLTGLGATYFATDNLRVSAGYAFGLLFPSVTNQSFFRDEHRSWQMVSYSYVSHRLRLTQMARSEQRFIKSATGEYLKRGYSLRQRFGYSVTLCIMVNNKQYRQGSYGGVLNEEILANAYAADHANRFDQNRAFAGMFYQLTNGLQLQLGYLNVVAATPKGYDVVHAIRMAVFQTIDCRKK
jgi:hypothetical protein